MMVQLWKWLGRLLSAGICSLPIWALCLGPRTGDHFTDLARLAIVVAVSWPLAITIANISNREAGK